MSELLFLVMLAECLHSESFFFIVLISFSSFFMLLLEDALVLDLSSSSSFNFLLGKCEDGCPFSGN